MPCVLAKSKTIELNKGESYFFEQKNITLLDINSKDEKILVCVNGIKGIVSDSRKVNYVDIKVKNIEKNSTKLRVDYECKDCVCEDCENIPCFDECKRDADCDDFDRESVDRCVGRPKKCLYFKPKLENEENIPEEVNISLSIAKKEDETRSLLKRFFKWLMLIFRK